MILSKPIKRETWIFTIEEPLQYHSAIIGVVEITFINRKFVKADYPFKGLHNAAEWDILGQIAAKIKEIDCQYSEGGC